MTRIALSIGIGPVGSFIAAGRRSRDLWWGSSWLAECTAEVATLLLEEGERQGIIVELLLPSQERLVALRAASLLGGGARRDFGGRVANHVRAVLAVPLTEQVHPSPMRALLGEVEARSHAWLAERVRSCWVRARGRISEEARRDGGSAFPLEGVVDEERFEAQVRAIAGGDFIRLAAGWCPLQSDDEAALSQALCRADEILEMARKTRSFSAAYWSRAGTRKSDLDPGRDGVLVARVAREHRSAAARSRAALGIRRGEQLDALGFARRIAAFDDAPESDGHPELGRLPFPPISRIALDPWIQEAQEHDQVRGDLARIHHILLSALRRDRHAFLAWCTPASDPTRRPDTRLDDQVFPFDASLFLEDGLGALEEEVRRLGSVGSLRDLARLASPVRSLHEALGLPEPYYALIEADGDGIGAALRGAPIGRYRALVRRLDSYADSVAERLREEVGGRAFYVGGDDALVIVPLGRLGHGLQTMADLFAHHMGEDRFTLSFGVVIAHVKDDLRSVRREASQAIRSAKLARTADRDATGGRWAPRGYVELRELPRSGAPRTCTGPHAEVMGSVHSLAEAVSRGQLSLRAPGLLLDAGRLVPPKSSPDRARLEAAAVSLARTRVRDQGERSVYEPAPPLLRELNELQTWSDVEGLAARIHLGARLARVGGRR